MRRGISLEQIRNAYESLDPEIPSSFEGYVNDRVAGDIRKRKVSLNSETESISSLIPMDFIQMADITLQTNMKFRDLEVDKIKIAENREVQTFIKKEPILSAIHAISLSPGPVVLSKKKKRKRSSKRKAKGEAEGAPPRKRHKSKRVCKFRVFF